MSSNSDILNCNSTLQQVLTKCSIDTIATIFVLIRNKLLTLIDHMKNISEDYNYRDTKYERIRFFTVEQCLRIAHNLFFVYYNERMISLDSINSDTSMDDSMDDGKNHVEEINGINDQFRSNEQPILFAYKMLLIIIFINNVLLNNEYYTIYEYNEEFCRSDAKDVKNRDILTDSVGLVISRKTEKLCNPKNKQQKHILSGLLQSKFKESCELVFSINVNTPLFCVSQYLDTHHTSINNKNATNTTGNSDYVTARLNSIVNNLRLLLSDPVIFNTLCILGNEKYASRHIIDCEELYKNNVCRHFVNLCSLIL